MDLFVGDLILVKGRGLISDVIEDVEQSPYSHTAGYVGPNEVMEAQGFEPTGYATLDKYRGMADVFRCNTATPKQKAKILAYVHSQAGGHYDYLLLLWELIRYKLHILLPYKEPSRAKICSGLWAAAYRKAGIDLCPGIKYPSPADLANSRLLVKVGSI